MSKYTTEVRYVCQMYADEPEKNDYVDIDEVISKAQNKVFSNYPIFDENYRAYLNGKILKHYYTREICEETVGLWKLRLATRMEEIMPYYNELYKTTLLKFNPLYDVDVTTEHSGSNSSNSDRNVVSDRNVSTTDSKTSDINREVNIADNSTDSESGINTKDESNTNSNTRTLTGHKEDENHSEELNLYADTPQGSVTNLFGHQGGSSSDPTYYRYLTDARKIDKDYEGESDNSETETNNGSSNNNGVDTYNRKNETTRNNNETSNLNSNENNISNQSNKENVNDSSNINSIDTYIERVRGKRGAMTYSRMLTEFRKTFLNIDKMIIEELSDLFFGLW